MTGLAEFGILNATAPSYGSASAQVQKGEAPSKLLLSVLIAKGGFYVAGANAVLGAQPAAPEEGKPTVPLLATGGYDYDGLARQIIEVKKAFPKETKIIIGAEGGVPYETVIATMDAVRETRGHQGAPDLFPDVTLAGL
jgi:hypothetical protein